MVVLCYFFGVNIFENNMVQIQVLVVGILFLIIFIFFGLLMIGYWSGFLFWQIVVICFIGGIFGVFYIILLCWVMVVQSELLYLEGVVVVEIFWVGSDGVEDEEDVCVLCVVGNVLGFYDIFGGGLVVVLFSFWSSGFKVFVEGFSVWFSVGQVVFCFFIGFFLVLVGVGYLMGIIVGIVIFIGVVIFWGVVVLLLIVNSVLVDGQSLLDLVI